MTTGILSLHGLRVLIIEENKQKRQRLVHTFQGNGAEVVAFAHPSEVTSLGSSLSFDLIVSRFLVPGITGQSWTAGIE